MSPSVVAAVLVSCVVVGLSAGEEEGAFSLVARSLERCGQRELGTCLRLRAVGLLDRALRSGPLQLNDYLSLTPDPAAEPVRAARALSEDEIAAALPQEPEARDQALDDMIAEKMTIFMRSRSIKFKLLPDDEFANEVEEGRKKDKEGKKGGYGIIFAMFGSMMLKMALAKLALLAGKALIVSKMALLLSAILGLKKLVSSGGESTQVVYATGGHEGGGGHGDWGRSDIAYSAHARKIRR